MVSGDGHAYERKDSKSLVGHVRHVWLCDQPLLGEHDLFVWPGRRTESRWLEGADEDGGYYLWREYLALMAFAEPARTLDFLGMS